ncbi:putative coiled-coil protein SlyX [Nonomuraea dietziae]|uniref:Putative coiled-coil protein SlyX n=1 Tax=Nonomuraea dietziae TaxID=65515 RepID=A0A7W5YUM3_9ACTN|nr:putative coiled-coil protein SlyX [Nonomuraea dietziae]
MSTDPWGRVDDDGTVYVRTAEGERAVGSWQAGEPEEALAYFHRKFDELAGQVQLLEQRVKGTDLAPAQAEATIVKLREAVADAHAVGDLGALVQRLDALTELVAKRREEVKAARDVARAEAKGIKERIVAEAERIAEETTHWKSGGERLRQLVEEWKTAERIDRVTEAALWKRLSAARTAFAKRRKAYFAGLDEQREGIRSQKERIVVEAEALADSTDWGQTAAIYRELMQQWKSAGRASREVEDELWGRFKAAQDQFFQARSAVFAERDASLAANAEAKEVLLAEAEKILPVTDARAARAALRSMLERWEAVGPVPREQRDRLEGGLRRIDDAVRKAEEAEWKRSNPEARARAQSTVDQLRSSIEQLEKKLGKAQAAGRAKDVQDAEEALAARRSWLEEAERTLAEFS